MTVFFKSTHSKYYDDAVSERNIISFLRPKSTKVDNIVDVLPYDLRIEVAKYFLETYLKENFFSRSTLSYYANDYSPYNSHIMEDIVSTNGYDCWVSVIDKEKEEYEIKNENFYDIYLNLLHEFWDNQIKTFSGEKDQEQKVLETMFDAQLTGYWLYYNHFNQNFLRVWLSYLKSKGYKINIFNVFNNKICKKIEEIKKGTSHYEDSKTFFNVLITIIDFYTAVIDIYGEENEKIITKLQNNLNKIFKENLEVEKLGFMNTFLYTKKIQHRYGLVYKKIYLDEGPVEYFWKLYGRMNPTVKKIFINALIYTWNKSPIPKVKNSMSLLLELSQHKYYQKYGFYYKNQDQFYKDIIMNANTIKKSVKTLLFSKAMTEDGGLFI